MNERFDGKVSVVTGGASGIGLAIVRRLLAEGGRVVIADVNGSALERLGAELGEAARTILVDVRDEDALEAMANLAHEAFGGLHVAFNCAGLSVFGTLLELAEGDWDTVLDVCLKGTFLAVKQEARIMIQSGGGAIVNVASLNSRMPMYGGGAYACAKAAVEMLSRNAALELAPHRIRVNTVSPGLTDTPLTAGLREVPGAEDAFMERIPLARWGTPEDMAAAALFLASDEAGYISGSNLIVDGAWETTGYPDLRPFREVLSP
ncbi:MAG: SDR family NAD(P)-dependent oxidoreductase [Pseudomonadales bacterium]|jgi:NAD(P)-dependent dehydrogenase (short-subunit alcohol dehydrogenase family)